MRYLDVCAGISAPSVAWKPLGWEAAAYSEIEAAPRAILEHRQGALPVGWDHCHSPGSNTTPLFGDFTQIEAHHVGPIDLLVGGTPCQDFSVAGLRAGLDGDRGNLSLEFLRLADRTRPRWLVWENVPGVLSQDGGRAFGAILGGMGELGYGAAYRVLDAQFFDLAQRRKRVFVVGYLGDWRASAAVLFERHSLCGNPAPVRQAGSRVAGTLGTTSHDWSRANPGDYDSLIPFDTTQITSAANYSNPKPGDPCHPLAATAHPPAIAFSIRGRDGGSQPEAAEEGLSPALRVSHGGSSHVFLAHSDGVRRLTPRECERLMGVPDDYTLVPYRGKPMADGPRYKCLGNSIAVPVLRWIGERIEAVETLAPSLELAA